MKVLQKTLIVLFAIFIFRSVGVRVCSSWAAYLNPFSSNCFDNPDGIPSNLTQILQRWGCTTEEYQLMTEDGYYILVVRAFIGSIRNPTPIVLAHGSCMNSLGWVTMNNKSIAYRLLKTGYQVFLINFRGNRYSTRHKTLTQKDEAYWQFSFSHMAKYDIPATMDLVASKSNEAKAIYIGFSTGSPVINIYCILYPEEAARKFAGVVHLGPIANLTGMRSAFRLVRPIWPVLKSISNAIWHGKVPLRNNLLDAFCSETLLGIFLCYTLSAMFLGANYGQMDPLRLPVALQQIPDETSLMVVDHYWQILTSNQFQPYDYGPERNEIEYGTPFPSPYNFSRILVPMAIFVGLNDYMAEPKNCLNFFNNLPVASRCGFKIMDDPHWSHDCFIADRDMHLFLNEDIISSILIMESNSCSLLSPIATLPGL